MKLSQLREKWEGGCEVIGVICHQDVYNYGSAVDTTVYVILEQDSEYHLHRYFETAPGEWEVSIDCTNTSLESCIAYIMDETSDLYPEEVADYLQKWYQQLILFPETNHLVTSTTTAA